MARSPSCSGGSPDPEPPGHRARLERTPTGDLFAAFGEHDADKLSQIVEAQAAGVLVDDLSPVDLWSLLISLAATWAQSAISYTASRQDPEPEHDRRRQALAATVRRAFYRTGSPG